MKLARVTTPDGIVRGEYDDGVVSVDGESYTVGDDAELVAPSNPPLVYCVSLNYPAYIEGSSHEQPEAVDFFIKPGDAIIDPGAPIPFPSFTETLGYGGEITAVIGEDCHQITPEEVPEVVLGYTIMNDLHAEDQPTQNTIVSFDNSAPLGSVIETDVDPRNLDMRTEINGEVRQDSNTEEMIFGPYEAIAELSQRFTFEEGDVIALGSPAATGSLEPGDEIEIWYEGVGTLRNTVTK